MVRKLKRHINIIFAAKPWRLLFADFHKVVPSVPFTKVMRFHATHLCEIGFLCPEIIFYFPPPHIGSQITLVFAQNRMVSSFPFLGLSLLNSEPRTHANNE